MNKTIRNQIDELRTLQKVRCTKPWTSLEERSVSGDYKVCCFIKRAIGHIDKLSDRDIMELRNSVEVQDLRSSMKNGHFGNWCPFGCPILHLRNQLFESQEFWDYDPEEYYKFPDAFRENRARMISDILEGKIDLNTYPVRLKLYPSDFCNIDCRMCDLEKTNVVEVGDAYFQNLFQLMPYLEDLTIFGGEPFSCPTSKRIIFGEELKRYPQIHLSTITNGTLLHERNQEKLMELRLGCFNFSLDSIKEETYINIRRGANFSRVMTNFKNFVKHAQTGKINIRRIEASCTIQETNYMEIPQFIEFTHSLGVEPVFSLVNKSKELLGLTNDLKRSINKGIDMAQRLGCNAAVNELTRVLDELPSYKKRESKELVLDPIRRIFGRKRVTYFFARHTVLKQMIRRMFRI